MGCQFSFGCGDWCVFCLFVVFCFGVYVVVWGRFGGCLASCVGFGRYLLVLGLVVACHNLLFVAQY